MKQAGTRTSDSLSARIPIAEIDTLNAYCAARGLSRTYVLRQLIRRLSLKDLSPEANLFRRLQANLPPLEEEDPR